MQYVIIIIVGGDNTKVTPEPIPNSEVKISHAEGSGNARIGNCRLISWKWPKPSRINSTRFFVYLK